MKLKSSLLCKRLLHLLLHTGWYRVKQHEPYSLIALAGGYILSAGLILGQIILYVLLPTIRHFGQVALVRTSCVVVLPSTTSSRFATSCTTVC